MNKNLSIEFIRKHIDDIDWGNILEWSSLDILEEFKDEIKCIQDNELSTEYSDN